MANGKIPGVTFTPEEIASKIERAADELLLRVALAPFDATAARARYLAGEVVSDPTPDQQRLANLVNQRLTFDATAARARYLARQKAQAKPGGSGE